MLVHVNQGGETFVYDYAERCELPCDACGGELEHSSARLLCVELAGGWSTRLASYTWWAFCSDRCREEWYAGGVDADLLPVSERPEDLHPLDRDIVLAVHHVDKRGLEAPLVSVLEAVLCPTAAAVNAFWRAPAIVRRAWLEAA